MNKILKIVLVIIAIYIIFQLLVIAVISIAALFAFGVFNPPLAGTCSGFDNLLYKDHFVNEGIVSIELANGTGNSIDIDSVSYGGDFYPAVLDGVLPSPNIGVDFRLTSNAGGPASGSYSGTITIAYTNNTSNLTHSETATCTGSV